MKVFISATRWRCGRHSNYHAERQVNSMFVGRWILGIEVHHHMDPEKNYMYAKKIVEATPTDFNIVEKRLKKKFYPNWSTTKRTVSKTPHISL